MRSNTGLLFALPALIVLFMLIAYPVAYTGWLSVTDDQGQFIGLAELRRRAAPARDDAGALEHALVGRRLHRLPGAAGGRDRDPAQPELRGPRARALDHAHPLGDPGIVAATTWAWMFHTEFGIINYMLTSAGALDEPVGWLTRGNTVMPAMIAINVWKLFPFVAIMVLAGLQSIPQELYEAARIDGANLLGRGAPRHAAADPAGDHGRHAAAGDLGAERHHHHLRHHQGRPCQPDPDHADPDLPARLRERRVQPGRGAERDVLRRRDA